MQPQTQDVPPLCLPPLARASQPRWALPAGATDCHCHVYQDQARYPLIAGRSYTPQTATLDQYLTMCDQVGMDRTVQVSASVYGTDNSLTLDVIAELGQHRARGVAGLPADATPAELERLDRGGMRGVRLSTHVKGYGGTAAIGAMAERLKPMGWHVQVHVADVDELVPLEDELLRVPVPLVFDHLGAVRGAQGPLSPGFQTLLKILRERDDCWTKISSWYRRSDTGAPDYRDIGPIVQALVQARPDRLVFGTNWPHPALFTPGEVPDDGHLIDLFCAWVPDPAVRTRILVDNPARLYGFE
ncbi:2-pyrone-4%2C6-dicarboxylic acid hydrolase [Bordetella ansorpii]|uniref:2-pyrone-4,6-dicarboxylic acid hydrolase n=1 Tax=Bordetella ansorpii TaxID=288768 RepID=A0A157NIP4_9BORD|nr:amidohydrolase family protein [Bordetella ansorpii]SAI21143.1 2-pyrone-4%2C6-dicarboxylic acid hydrolase [Bordetella ansorpii]